ASTLTGEPLAGRWSDGKGIAGPFFFSGSFDFWIRSDFAAMAAPGNEKASNVNRMTVRKGKAHLSCSLVIVTSFTIPGSLLRSPIRDRSPPTAGSRILPHYYTHATPREKHIRAPLGLRISSPESIA